MKRALSLPSLRERIAPVTNKMSASPCPLLRLRMLALAILCSLAALPRVAAADEPAVIRGRVLNTSNGSYVRNAVVTVIGSNVSVLTDDYGEYIIGNVPAAEVTVRATYGSLSPQEQRVVAAAGRVAVLDFNLKPAGAGTGDIVMLDTYTVQSRRETDGKMIAISEQRYAPNIKNVVSADEYGDVADGNVGEFLKYLPGVLVDFNAADASSISVRGLPSSATPVMMDGNRIASAASGGATRTFEFEQASLNNMSRVELTKAPTPDVPADTLGGMVNLISKSAFERAKPSLAARTYLSMNSTARSLGETYMGPDGNTERLVKPGGDFTYINPLTKNFGFVVNGLVSNQYNPEYLTQTNWTPYSSSVPANTKNGVSAANPFMGNYRLQIGSKLVRRMSAGLTMDWRVAPRDILTLRYQYNDFDTNFYLSRYYFDAGLSPTFTQNTTTGTDSSNANGGSANAALSWRHKYGNTNTWSLAYKHNGPVWKMDGSLAYSKSVNRYRDISDGFFGIVTAGIRGALVSFQGVQGIRPDSIAVSKGGVNIDPFDLAKYNLYATPNSRNANGYTGAVGGNASDASDTVKGGNFNIRRDFGGRLPFSLKAGVDARQTERDIRVNNPIWKYVGPDKTEDTADDSAAPFINKTFSTTPAPFGWGQISYLDAKKIHDQFLDPDTGKYFTEVQDGLYGTIANNVKGSMYIEETVLSAYLRGDLKLLRNRLWLVGGVRFEATEDKAAGPLNDQSALYQKDAGGNIKYGSDNKPILITSDPVAQAKLRFKERANMMERSYNGLYPSLNATYAILEDLIVRASYARTIRRPNLDYIIPNTAVPAPANDGTAEESEPLITVNNTGLKPWHANNYDLSVEYYFAKSGMVSAGVFRKDFSDFWNKIIVVDPPAEMLEKYGLDPEANSKYRLQFWDNGDNARVDGVECNYNQQLRFLPSWGRGFSVFANATWLRLQGEKTADFSGFVPRMINWGVSYNHKRFSVMLKWVNRAEQRLAQRTGTGVPADTFEYLRGGTKLDINAEVRLSRHFSLYGTARNVTNEPLVLERKSPETPDYAKHYNTQEFGVIMTFGLKATF